MLKIQKKNLLIIAASVWLMAGTMLIMRGVVAIENRNLIDLYNLLIGLISGTLFYILMFRKIVVKHTDRILSLSASKQYFFNFFSLRSYILMFSMITMGILVRISGLIPIIYLGTFYILMGVPLCISGLNFAYNRIKLI